MKKNEKGTLAWSTSYSVIIAVSDHSVSVPIICLTCTADDLTLIHRCCMRELAKKGVNIISIMGLIAFESAACKKKHMISLKLLSFDRKGMGSSGRGNRIGFLLNSNELSGRNHDAPFTIGNRANSSDPTIRPDHFLGPAVGRLGNSRAVLQGLPSACDQTSNGFPTIQYKILRNRL